MAKEIEKFATNLEQKFGCIKDKLVFLFKPTQLCHLKIEGVLQMKMHKKYQNRQKRKSLQPLKKVGPEPKIMHQLNFKIIFN
jgi:hypothetical protein